MYELRCVSDARVLGPSEADGVQVTLLLQSSFHFMSFMYENMYRLRINYMISYGL